QRAWEDNDRALIRKSGHLAIGASFFGARDAGRILMRTSRLRRQAAVCRGLYLGLYLVLLTAAPTRAADMLTGVVVDQSGQPLPRAFVRVFDASGAESASGFTDESGAFRLGPAAAHCRVD